MSRSDMLRMAKQCALLEGFGGMPPEKIFLKWCNLVEIHIDFSCTHMLRHMLAALKKI